jgi:hypothetical protein
MAGSEAQIESSVGDEGSSDVEMAAEREVEGGPTLPGIESEVPKMNTFLE